MCCQWFVFSVCFLGKKTLKKHLKKDRAKVSLSDFSNFGLLEMTRQRIRLDLIHTYKEECSTCNGSGLILSKESSEKKPFIISGYNDLYRIPINIPKKLKNKP